MATKLLRVAVFCAVLAGGCGDKDTSPSAINVAGTWNGNLATLLGTARVTWVLTQAGNAVTGTASVVDPTAGPLFNGPLSGSVSGSTLTYNVTIAAGGVPLVPGCSGRIDGTMAVNGSSMSGAFTGTSSCPSQLPLTGGNLTMSKQ
jgi:hypothetical protein